MIGSYHYTVLVVGIRRHKMNAYDRNDFRIGGLLEACH